MGFKTSVMPFGDGFIINVHYTNLILIVTCFVSR